MNEDYDNGLVYKPVYNRDGNVDFVYSKKRKPGKMRTLNLTYNRINENIDNSDNSDVVELPEAVFQRLQTLLKSDSLADEEEIESRVHEILDIARTASEDEDFNSAVFQCDPWLVGSLEPSLTMAGFRPLHFYPNGQWIRAV